MSQPAPTKQHDMRHDMETMAALVAMERLMAKRSAAVPRLLEFVARFFCIEMLIITVLCMCFGF